MNRKNRIPGISRILKVERFEITCLWNTGETKVIDFEKLFKEWDLQPDDIDYALTDYEVFKQVGLTDTLNLCWEPIKINGMTYDLDPIVMYEAGELVENPKENNISKLIKEARLAAGMSQVDLAIRSGTTKHYLSRLENGKSNIAMDTLTRIIETGLGKKLKVEIE